MNIASFPSRLVLELTPLCNLNCPMCPRHYIKETEGYMGQHLFRKLVDELEVENIQTILLPFWRGESCLHPDFSGLMNYALDKKIRIHISTNGHFMGQEFMDIFYRCEFVTFSLHSDLGYKNAKKFVESKPKWSQVTTQVSFVDSEKSTKKILAECSDDMNLKGFDSLRLYVEHTIKGEFGRSSGESMSSRIFCPKLSHTFVVSADGGYSRCNHIWNPEVTPNLATASIKEVWRGARMKEVRADYPDEKCGSCDQWTGHTNGEAWRKNANGLIDHVIYGVSDGR